MSAKGARWSMGSRDAQRKVLSILHIILKPNPDPNAHPNPQSYT